MERAPVWPAGQAPVPNRDRRPPAERRCRLRSTGDAGPHPRVRDPLPPSCSTSSAATRATTTCTPRRRSPRRSRSPRAVRQEGGQVAMFVAESRAARRRRARGLRPVARRRADRPPPHRRALVTLPHRRPALRAGLAKGKYDAYLLMPRGVRDEEFHTAVCELLSDWGSTVATPEVVTVAHHLARGRRPDPERSATTSTGWACPTASTRPTATSAARCSRRVERRARLSRRRRRWTSSPTSPRIGARRRRAHLRPAGRHRPRPGRRRRHRRCRTGRPRGRRLRLVRGPDDRRARGRGGRRPGRHVVDDPQLPRLPARHLRYAARPAGAQPGDPLRHPLLQRLAGHPPGARRRRRPRTCCAPRAATCAPAPSSSRPA